MKSFKKIIISMALFLSLLSCDVTFDEELREYVDNIVARSPLDFSLSDSELIDDYDSINWGYVTGSSTASYTITNNENIDIKIAAFEGISGDFTITAFEAFTLLKGETYTFDITLTISGTNYLKLVSKEVKFADTGGREYTFYLWATTKIQPLAIYNSDGVEISEFDLGAWDDNRVHTLILKNEGLENLLVSSISVPSGITFSGENSFTMEINEEREINLTYVPNTEVNNQNMVFNTDIARMNSLSLALYAGGSLPVDILDSGLSILSGDLYVGEYVTGDPISQTFYLKNYSLFDMNLDVSFDEGMFIVGLADTALSAGESIEFQVLFLAPEGSDANQSTNLQLRDLVSDRTFTRTITGLYSPVP